MEKTTQDLLQEKLNLLWANRAKLAKKRKFSPFGKAVIINNIKKELLQMRQDEAKIQMEFVKCLQIKHPNILFTIAPNGMKLPIGVAVKMKKMGYRKGTPDVIIFEARKGYNGLLIEMKTEDGRLSEEQIETISMLSDRGYKTIVCRAASDALAEVEAYIKR